MYEPSHFKVEDRELFVRHAGEGEQGVPQGDFARPNAARPAITSIPGTFKPGHGLHAVEKSGVLNGLSADPESKSQAITQMAKAHAFGASA